MTPIKRIAGGGHWALRIACILLLPAAAMLLSPDLVLQPPFAESPKTTRAYAPPVFTGTGFMMPPEPVWLPHHTRRSPTRRRATRPSRHLRPMDPMAAARRAPAPATEPCPSAATAKAAVFLFPHQPVQGQPVRVVAVGWSQTSVGKLHITLNGVPLSATQKQSTGGAPHVLEAQLLPTGGGKLAVRLEGARGGHTTSACATRTVATKPPVVPTYAPYAEVWPVTRQWDRWSEALFSAWVARLFHVSRGGQGGWLPLHQVTRDASRNWLHNAFGLKEDEASTKATVILMPDCGDLPYFLRAYFAWKLGLPFAFQRCTRGNAITGPICPVGRNNLTTRYVKAHHPVRRFNRFTREWIGWGVHSGTARTVAADSGADFYPVALNARALRPGRIFVDPSGHVFVVSQRREGNRKSIGLLFGVDAHPDRTISRKRFSRGTFVFDSRWKTGGFKAFRPLRYENGRIRKLTNEELAQRPDDADFSDAQARFENTPAFYAAVQRVLNPKPVDPTQLYRSKILALYEATRERVKAVAMGVAYMRRTRWKAVPIPRGPAIFETTGPWEVYSTPARDLRLLMAIQDVLDFPRDVRRHKTQYRIPKGWSDRRLRRELRSVYDALTPVLQVSYRRSDRSVWTLSLADVIRRREALRMGYHPNDCPEIRWGATATSPEGTTCTRRAAQHQRHRMKQYEVWFQLLKRPTQHG